MRHHEMRTTRGRQAPRRMLVPHPRHRYAHARPSNGRRGEREAAKNAALNLHAAFLLWTGLDPTRATG
eukprot:2009006-Pyramimonas_sp.AAC.1